MNAKTKSKLQSSLAFCIAALAISLVLLAADFPHFHAAGALSFGAVPSGLGSYERWFGSLHSHTGMDGDGGAPGATATDAFAYAKNVSNLQFFALTPHVHQSRDGESLYSDRTYQAVCSSAAGATSPFFVALAGQEVSTISTGGHWNLFNASKLVGADHPDGDWNDADDYYDHVAGLGKQGEQIAAAFNHPAISHFGDRYASTAAPYFGTAAIWNGPFDSTASDFSDSNAETFVSAWEHLLNLGWKVSPTADQDNHQATWGACCSEFTVIVRARGTLLNPSNVLRGLREHMTYATQDPNMQIAVLANGWSMGQTIGASPNVSLSIWWNNPSGSVCNRNLPVCRTESPGDSIQKISIYRKSLTAPVASFGPGAVAGEWNIVLPASVGDWFVVKFQDKYSLAPLRAGTGDVTWSAPIWYDPVHADPPLGVPYLIHLPFVSR